MSTPTEIIAAAIAKRPHSFQLIRESTGLTLTDREFASVARSDPTRSMLVRFRKWDDEVIRVRPGRPRVALREPSPI